MTMGADSVAKWAGSSAVKASLGAATFVSNAATFARSAINLESCRYNHYQKYEAGELGWNWETAAEAGAAVFSAAACVVSGKNIMKEAKTLGRMMKEDNVEYMHLEQS